MGCGKSSVGRKLSELLCCPFMDLDAVIEEQAGRSIPEIFDADGEKVFSDIEKAGLTDVFSATMAVSSRGPLPQPSCGPLPLAGGGKMPLPLNSHTPQKTNSYKDTFILSLGGGTIMTPECEELVHEKTLCIYLRTSVDTLVSRLSSEAAGRPMLNPCHDVIPSEAEGSATQTETLRTRIESLMSLRASTYERTAHIIIDTDSHTIDSLAQALANKIDANR